jgi:hypothetical protein
MRPSWPHRRRGPRLFPADHERPEVPGRSDPSFYYVPPSSNTRSRVSSRSPVAGSVRNRRRGHSLYEAKSYLRGAISTSTRSDPIRPTDAKILDAYAAWLKDNALQQVLIEGHCDRGVQPLARRAADESRDELSGRAGHGQLGSRSSATQGSARCAESTTRRAGLGTGARFLVKPGV